MTRLEILDKLEDELTRATIDENWRNRVGRQAGLRARFNAPDLTIRYMGPFQVINLEGREITLGAMATDGQIAEEIKRIRPPPIPTEKPKMPTIAEQLKAARAKLTEARDGAANAIAVSQDASRVVLGEVTKVLKEAEDLRAEVAELTNGGPE
jgi:hypothetical protein